MSFPKYQKEPGDWKCNNCGKDNFKKRTSCFGCHMSKYYHSHADRSQPGEYKHGDWICPVCNFKIYGSKNACKKCNTKRPDKSQSSVELKIQPKEGDWACPKCTDYQFAKNKFCRNCGTPNPTNPTNLNDNNEELELTEECVICMENPKNSTLIHGDSGHSCCCLDCAKSLYANGGNCPICRRLIEKVIQNFN